MKTQRFNARQYEKYFPADVKYTHPVGGLFTWVELREDLDAKELMKDALAENVAYVPGGSFFPNGGHENYFRLNYSCMSDRKIVEGVKDQVKFQINIINNIKLF